jgi:predicted nucleotidyltransferase
MRPNRPNQAPVAGRIRLSREDLAAMARVFSESLGDRSDAKVRLFGSRTDPSRRGGDIDLLVVVPRIDPQAAFQMQLELGARLQEALGEQRIDIKVTPSLEAPEGSAFVRLVAPESIQIWP